MITIFSIHIRLISHIHITLKAELSYQVSLCNYNIVRYHLINFTSLYL